MLREVLSFLFIFVLAHSAYGAECFSPSYSVQKGREARSNIESRDLMGNEFQDIKDLLEGLNGDWDGSGQFVRCEGEENLVRKEIENYTIHSKMKMDSAGEFVIESTLKSQEKRTTQHESFRLYLTRAKLATRPDIPVSDIELVSVSQNELTFVTKNRGGSGYPYASGFVNQETVITIKKTTATSLVFEKSLYAHGKLIAMSTWQTDKK